MRRYMTILCTAFLLLVGVVGCGQVLQSDQGESLQLYYTTGETNLYGEAILGEPCAAQVGGDVLLLMNTLLTGPTDPNLTSPFPVGTKILWAGWLPDGTLVVNLSEEYSGLMGVDLTLADYCIVRTLCQLEGVERVEILVINQENSFRNHQILSLDDIL